MNVENNHLISAEYYEKLDKGFREKYGQVPDHLEKAAKKKLAGKQDAYVSKTSGGSLSKWAAKVRKNNKIDL